MQRSALIAIVGSAFLWLAATVALDGAPRNADGQLRIKIVDSNSGEALPARLHLQNSRRRPVKLPLPGARGGEDFFYVDGQVELPLRAGQYSFHIEATPEYRTQSGHFEIERHADDEKTVEMRQFADLAREGWWGGDLETILPPAKLPLRMRAEGVTVAGVIADPEKVKMAVEPPEMASIFSGKLVESASQGDLVIYNLRAPLKDDARKSPAATSLESLTEAKGQGGVVIARSALSWNLPVWLASEQLDAIQVIDSHSLRDRVTAGNESDRPGDPTFFHGPASRARWAEAIYFHVLNCGFRIPPVAGSGAEANGNPLGTNRVYVHCGEEFTADDWWNGLSEGKVFITNGPLLRPLVEGRPPGYVFRLVGAGDSADYEIGLNLATRDPIEYLYIVRNGEIVADVRLDEIAKQAGRLPPVHFSEAGWFLVRAATGATNRYQFALSGPYFVEQNGRPRVSRRSVSFFLDWISAGERRLRTLEELDDELRQKLLTEHAEARAYFENLLAEANAE